MKNALTVLAIATILASCSPNTEEAKKGDAPAAGTITNPENFIIDTTTANNWIQNYHRELGEANIQDVSFMIDAQMLREYLADPEIKKLDVYLAKKDDGAMTLIYIGAKEENGEFVEKVYEYNGAGYMLDHVQPCPNCPRQPLHHYGSE